MDHGVIFDMDGVLVDSGDAHLKSWQFVGRADDVNITDEAFRGTFGRTSREIIRMFWGDDIDERRVRKIDHDKEVAYREILGQKVPLVPGIRRLLERLKKAKFAIAVATSGPPENLELVLSDGLIANYFDAEVHGFDVMAGKPAPDCFLLAAHRLNLPPGGCIVVEDAPVGIQAARRAGMPAIALIGTQPAERLKDAGAATVVKSHDEITIDLVRSLLP